MKKVRKIIKRVAAAALAAAVAAGLTGCGSVTSGKRIIRVSHAQSETHPEHIGLLAFKEYVEERLGDKYEVQIFPNEILGSAQKAIELTQTGAIDLLWPEPPILRRLQAYTKYSVCPIFSTQRMCTSL